MSNFSNRRVYFSQQHAEKLGWVSGGIIPALIFITKILVFYGQLENFQKIPLIALIAGGLAYSAPTVKKLIFGMLNAEIVKFWKISLNTASLKAWGFTILLEGVLIFTPLTINFNVSTKAEFAKAVILIVLQYAASLASLAFLAGVNGYCMAELAVNRFVKPAKEAIANKKPKTGKRLELVA